MVTNIPFFMSSVTKLFILDMTSEAERLPRALHAERGPDHRRDEGAGNALARDVRDHDPTVRSSTAMKSK